MVHKLWLQSRELLLSFLSGLTDCAHNTVVTSSVTLQRQRCYKSRKKGKGTSAGSGCTRETSLLFPAVKQQEKSHPVKHLPLEGGVRGCVLSGHTNEPQNHNHAN